MIQDKLDAGELERLLALYGREYPAGYILYRLARLLDEKDDYAAAERCIKTFMGQYTDHPLMKDARSLSRSLAERLEGEIRTVGCILPLTGRFASYGNRMLDAIVLASGVFDVSRETRFRLAVRDSKSDPAEARRAADDLVFDENAIALLGPLESRSAFEAADRANHLRVPIMTLTQAHGVTELGDYVFRNFITTGGQVQALVDYAVNRLGVRRFAVLYPDNAYGREMMFRFWYAAATAGGAVEGMEPYEQDKTDFSKEIRRLVNLESRKSETDIPDIHFDAIFIPDSALKARLIAPQLDFHDVIGVRMLGTSEWNVPDLLEGETDYLEGAVFVDVFFKDSSAPEVTSYLDKFYSAFGREADGIEALAYDAASILIEGIVNGGARTPDDLRDWLSDLRNYSGVTGITSFSGNGDARKQLSVLSVQDGRIVQLE
ncbi:MAG TPA: penicillin-binding protein activator [Deltaproteobacteria bacterium]|nr:penicillin-binding protein activator [Deltaproteobacteria bacterium]